MTAQELAQKHWEYVSATLKTHDVPDSVIKFCEWHYISSFVHGFKHGQEELKS